MERKAGFCALCRSRCGAQYLVSDDGRLVGVEPWPEHPTGGSLCAKGRAAPELLYHPRRLTRPLARTRPRDDPDPGWVETSWDNALDDIAARLDRIKRESGAEAVAFSSASPGASALSDSLDWIQRLIFAFGSPNFLTNVEICNWHRDYGHAFTFGTSIGVPDYAQAELIILWGFNPANVWLAQAHAIADARARGAKLLVIDPAGTRHARDADRWLRVRPGSDAALALGLAHWLIRHHAYDEDFVRRWSNGPFLIRDDTGAPLTERDLDPARASDRPLGWSLATGSTLALVTEQALPDAVAPALALHGRFEVATAAGRVHCRPAFERYAEACADYTADRVAALTGIAAADFEAAARLLAGARRISYFTWTGISQHVDATQADRAIALLYALTGCVDAPGGNRHLARQPVNPANDRALLPQAQRRRALGLAERPLGPPAHGWTLGRDFHEAVLAGRPYQVRALVGFGANLLMSQADTARARAALQALEFQVHCDLFETPTGRHADYLLPVNTPWEREALRVGFEIDADADALVQLRQPIVAQAAGNHARSDLEIVFGLATRLGLGDHFFGGCIEAGWDHMLAPLGLTTRQLRAEPAGIRRPVAQRPRGYAAEDASGRVRGFATPSRRVELYSPQLAAHGYPPLPRATEPRTAVALTAAESASFPLTLACAKSGYYCQSQHRALASLRRREPEPFARLHPALAAARGIGAGDWFVVRTRRGTVRFRARLDDALEPTLVQASFGWWQACDDLGWPAVDPLAPDASHLNAVIDSERLDPLSGSIPLRAFPCDIGPDPTVTGRGWSGWKACDARLVSRPAVDVVELELALRDGSMLPSYRPGQSIQVAFESGGRRFERHYSLIGAARAGGHRHYRIAVRHSPLGDGLSDALHRALDRTLDHALDLTLDHVPGASPPADAAAPPIELSLQTPRGGFTLPLARATPVVLFAAGIGITPFLAMLETLAERPADANEPPILLLYGNRDHAHHAYRQRLAVLAQRLPCLTIVDVYSRPDTGIADRTHIGTHLVPPAWFDRSARHYLCGPDAMLRTVTADLLARGVPRFAIFQERFQAPPRAAAGRHGASGPFQVRFDRSGVTLTWTAADGSLLDLAAAHGLELPSGCRVGQCESCRVELRSGAVAHGGDLEPDTPETCIACLAVPVSDLVIDA
ncbi:MAG: molybdopterin-dependent oxidoreductase [Lautropia sp.]